MDLVFATAYRQVGDTGLAEEITQNVFVRLARKATVLAGHETIAGWLRRCAVLHPGQFGRVAALELEAAGGLSPDCASDRMGEVRWWPIPTS